MVEIFKTNVYEVERSEAILHELLEHFPGNKINFDLEDCDKILRVEGDHILPDRIMELLNARGHLCEVSD